MKAIQIDSHGPVSELDLAEVREAPLGPDEVRVRVEAAGINPSDVGSRLGWFPGFPLPRILGRDFAGTVIEGSPDLVGAAVWGSGGDLGFTRDGTHAETIVVPTRAVVRRPRNISAEQAAAAGVPFVTAWTALELAGVAAGETVLISGAAGSVGTAAIRLARVRGARAVALVRDSAETERVRVDDVLAVVRSDSPTFSEEMLESVRARTGGRGCDVALNGVGAPVFDAMLSALADGGRMVVYSAVAGREVQLDLLTLYRRRIRIAGLTTAIVDAVRAAEILDRLTPLFESGALLPLDVTARFPLAKARDAYAAVQRGAVGKIVLVPAA